jgi:integrase
MTPLPRTALPCGGKLKESSSPAFRRANLSNPEAGAHFVSSPAFQQDRRAVPTAATIPLRRTSIAAFPSKHLTFLVTHLGKPFTTAGFGNAMRDWCDQANLRHCSAHGLRKATAAALAEAGASVHEIQSVTGHRTLSEMQRYTAAAERKHLADSAMTKLKG